MSWRHIIVSAPIIQSLAIIAAVPEKGCLNVIGVICAIPVEIGQSR